MKLKEISHKREEIGGGPRSGVTTTKIFKCPCGKGTIEQEKDDIPGFKTSSVYVYCDTCKKEFDWTSCTIESL